MGTKSKIKKPDAPVTAPTEETSQGEFASAAADISKVLTINPPLDLAVDM